MKDGDGEEGGDWEDYPFPAQMAGCLKPLIRMGERRNRQGWVLSKDLSSELLRDLW